MKCSYNIVYEDNSLKIKTSDGHLFYSKAVENGESIIFRKFFLRLLNFVCTGDAPDINNTFHNIVCVVSDTKKIMETMSDFPLLKVNKTSVPFFMPRAKNTVFSLPKRIFIRTDFSCPDIIHPRGSMRYWEAVSNLLFKAGVERLREDDIAYLLKIFAKTYELSKRPFATAQFITESEDILVREINEFITGEDSVDNTSDTCR